MSTNDRPSNIEIQISMTLSIFKEFEACSPCMPAGLVSRDYVIKLFPQKLQKELDRHGKNPAFIEHLL